MAGDLRSFVCCFHFYFHHFTIAFHLLFQLLVFFPLPSISLGLSFVQLQFLALAFVRFGVPPAE